MFGWLSTHWNVIGMAALYLVATALIALAYRRLFPWIIQGLGIVSGEGTWLNQISSSGYRAGSWAIMATGIRLIVDYLGQEVPWLAGHSWWSSGKLAIQAVIVLLTGLFVRALINALLDWHLQRMPHTQSPAWNNALVPLVKKLNSLIVLLAVTAVVLRMFNVQITALLTTAGLASIAAAAAAKSIFSNTASGLTLLIDRPFRVGDTIETSDGKFGEVIEIGMRTTTLKQPDNTSLILPNESLMINRIINYAMPDQRRAVRLPMTISYQADLGQAKTLVLEAMRRNTAVLQDPAPDVQLTDFAANGVQVINVAWIADYRMAVRVRDELIMDICNALKSHGVEFGGPPSPPLPASIPTK